MSKPTTIEMEKAFCCLSTCYHAIYVPRTENGPWFCCKEHMEQHRNESGTLSQNVTEDDGRAITDLINDDREAKLIKAVVSKMTDGDADADVSLYEMRESLR